jgi:hypothetical protein
MTMGDTDAASAFKLPQRAARASGMLWASWLPFWLASIVALLARTISDRSDRGDRVPSEPSWRPCAELQRGLPWGCNKGCRRHGCGDWRHSDRE